MASQKDGIVRRQFHFRFLTKKLIFEERMFRILCENRGSNQCIPEENREAPKPVHECWRRGFPISPPDLEQHKE